MSIFSGYPSGAKITSELIKSHRITPREGQKILTFSSTSGPLFIIGAVGAGMLKNIAAGYIIFISHIIGAIINGIILKYFSMTNHHVKETSNNTLLLNDNKPTGNIMSNAIGNSLYTSGFIGGYIILFSVIITLLDKITFFSAITNIFSMFLPNNISWFPGVLIKSSLEISNGCKIVSSLPNGFELRLILLCFIISFSGLSIIGQVASIISRTGINIKTYIFTKLSHGVISCFLCYIFLKIDLLQVTTSNTASFNIINYNIFLLQLLLCIILLLNILSVINKNFHK
jgi:sporulation integral membrane protein YlbJ